MTPLLDKRLVFVTGKGGVGKTTVSAALGLVAARRGKRTILCEVARQSRLPRLLDPDAPRDVGFNETELAPGLSAISIDPQGALEEYLRLQIKSGTLYSLLFKNRIFEYFTAATPGMRELVTMGKVWELAQLQRRTVRAAPYDLVIVDFAASGHGLGMLSTPRTFRDVARVGPIRRQANMIHSFIVDASQTGVAVVALPVEMPVNETLDFRRRLREEMGMELDAVVANGLYPERFSASEAERLAEAAASSDGRVSEAGATALRAALAEHRRARFQRAQLRRLRRAGPAIALPYLFEPELDLESLGRLSRELERKL
jgi:anion-transporting  ArsA/GET3 family ATPase